MKPYIICHMMSPLDGRLVVERWAPDGSPLNERMIAEYQRIHDGFEADAWLAGTKTMTEFATGAAPAHVDIKDTPARPWHLADAGARRFAIAIDRKAQLHWSKPSADNGHVVVVLAASVPDAHLAELVQAGVSYLVMPGDDVDLAAMLNELATRLPIKKLLLEGGARMNGAFLKAGLVDELSLLLCPAIDGSTGASSIFEAGEGGLGGVSHLQLLSATPGAHHTCHLRYRVTQA
jgi:riboflavin biosynthesis pyrimidine reductase